MGGRSGATVRGLRGVAPPPPPPAGEAAAHGDLGERGCWCWARSSTLRSRSWSREFNWPRIAANWCGGTVGSSCEATNVALSNAVLLSGAPWASKAPCSDPSETSLWGDGSSNGLSGIGGKPWVRREKRVALSTVDILIVKPNRKDIIH